MPAVPDAPSTDATPGVPRARGLRARLLPALLFSLALHGLLLTLIAVVAVELFDASEDELPPGPPVTISFRDPAPAPIQPEAPTPNASSQASRAPELPEPELPALPSPELPAATLPGLRPDSSRAPAAALADLQPRMEDSSGAVFAGVRARGAQRIVYAVDVSGAMVSTLPFVIEELRRSIDKLHDSQQFQVVLFRAPSSTGASVSREPIQVFRSGRDPRAGLVQATPGARAALAQWLATVAPGGRSSPIAGLRAALAMNPDVVFLLARSIPRSGEDADRAWGGGLERVLAELDRLNPSHPATGYRPITIKTIQFLEDDPSGIMQAIARNHGGGEDAYTLLTLNDLE